MNFAQTQLDFCHEKYILNHLNSDLKPYKYAPSPHIYLPAL